MDQYSTNDGYYYLLKLKFTIYNILLIFSVLHNTLPSLLYTQRKRVEICTDLLTAIYFLYNTDNTLHHRIISRLLHMKY